MAPKENKKASAKKEREAREREELFARQRKAAEDDEEAARGAFMQGEKVARLEEVYLPFKAQQCELMVDALVHRKKLQEMEEQRQKHEAQERALQAELHLIGTAKRKLEEELVDIRLEQKVQLQKLPLRMKQLEQALIRLVTTVVDSFEGEKLADSHTVLQNFRFQFGLHKQSYLDLLCEVRERLKRYSEVLLESRSVHSNVPARIREALRREPADNLLYLIDALAYDDSVVEYLQDRYPAVVPREDVAAEAEAEAEAAGAPAETPATATATAADSPSSVAAATIVP